LRGEADGWAPHVEGGLKRWVGLVPGIGGSGDKEDKNHTATGKTHCPSVWEGIKKETLIPASVKRQSVQKSSLSRSKKNFVKR